jgi:hypothetical protein
MNLTIETMSVNPTSEATDLLAKLGIEALIEFEDYLKGFDAFGDK